MDKKGFFQHGSKNEIGPMPSFLFPTFQFYPTRCILSPFYTTALLCFLKKHNIYQPLPLQDPPKFTQIGILGLTLYHLATPLSGLM
jgi:hypothetical protein